MAHNLRLVDRADELPDSCSSAIQVLPYQLVRCSAQLGDRSCGAGPVPLASRMSGLSSAASRLVR